MNANELIFRRGLPEGCRASAAALYDNAFGQKLSVAVRSEEKRLSMLEACLVSEYAIVALDGDELAGVSGFRAPSGSFTGGLVSGNAGYDYHGVSGPLKTIPVLLQRRRVGNMSNSESNVPWTGDCTTTPKTQSWNSEGTSHE